MARKRPLFGPSKYIKKTKRKRPGRHAKSYSKRRPKRKRPGRHAKRPNKHKKRTMKKYIGQGRK